MSRTALAVGEEAFQRDPYVRAELEPRFITYDGRRLPLDDASVDRVICFDAFHHVPNPQEILSELFRVLRPGGRLVMAEPGAGHAHSDAAEFETAHYGVLENELVLSELIADARRAQFDAFEIKPYPEVDNLTLSEAAHLRLLAGDHSVYPLHHVVAGMRELHVLAMLKGGSVRDSRNPGELKAQIDMGTMRRVEGHSGKQVVVPVTVANRGDTVWLAEEDAVCGGYVSLGGHLHDAGGNPLRVGYLAQRLPRDLAPGQTVSVPLTIGLPEVPGTYLLRLDLVDDRIVWFSQVGSPTVDLELAVVSPDSRDPHRFEARIEALGAFPPRLVGPSFELSLRLTNTGDTTWLPGAAECRGAVQVGVQRLGPDGMVEERDYFRVPLPSAIKPGESTEVSATVPFRAGGGRAFAVDLVTEQVCWFVSHGSKPLSFVLRV